MGRENKMKRVGFISSVSKEWMGGLNYFTNLLFAISSLEKKEIEVFVFVGKNTDYEIKNMFKRYATVVEHSMFDRKSFPWFLSKIENKLLKTNYLLENILKKYNINILSHTSRVNLKSCKTINWIPDFQHLHLPEMFSKKEIKQRNNFFLDLIRYSDRIILSSYDALNDFKSFAPKYLHKASVLQFVSQPNVKYYNFQHTDIKILLDKYQIPQEFFYLPNQFWIHKNHMLVFEAVKKLVDENFDICLVCTGYLKDYRSTNYINTIRKFIKTHNLENNIRLLGLVDYEDVFKLIKCSKAVINPSLFEGWSSTVEECKSVSKNMILSDLNVHKEQYPNALFFNRYNIESLKKILKDYNYMKTSDSTSNLKSRTESFAQKYVNILIEVLK